MKKIKIVLVIFPTLNEFENIPLVIDRLKKVIKSDILFVDDGSTDGTVELIQNLVKMNSHISAIYREKKLGLGSAYREAYAYALTQDYEYLIQCDADGSHEIEKIPTMLAAANNGAELVIGSRYVKGGSVSGWAKSRQFISKVGNIYSRITLGLKTKDNTAGFRLYNLETLRKIDFHKAKANGYAFQVQMTYLFKEYKVDEVPIRFVERLHGKSKMNTKIAIEAILKIPLLRFH